MKILKLVLAITWNNLKRRLLWDKIRCLAFIWCKAYLFFKGCLLQICWGIGWLCNIDVFCSAICYFFSFILRSISYSPFALYYSFLCLNWLSFKQKKKKWRKKNEIQMNCRTWIENEWKQSRTTHYNKSWMAGLVKNSRVDGLIK